MNKKDKEKKRWQTIEGNDEEIKRRRNRKIKK